MTGPRPLHPGDIVRPFGHWIGHHHRCHPQWCTKAAALANAADYANREEIVLDSADHANVHLAIAERLRERFGPPADEQPNQGDIQP
jgi:hypothetical protein